MGRRIVVSILVLAATVTLYVVSTRFETIDTEYMASLALWTVATG